MGKEQNTKDRVSVIYTHWAMNDSRSDVMRTSIESLIETAHDSEIIVVDNGGSVSDSEYLLSLAEKQYISCYVRNRFNMHFWYARNQGLKLATGEYLVISDNDIRFHSGWMEECRSFLERNEGKYLCSPIEADWINAVRDVRWCGEVDGWKLNYRAGSNIFMMRRKDFEKIGFFDQHRIAGSKFTDRYVRLGYKMAMMPEPKAFDMGFRRGYNINNDIPHLIS